MAKFISFIKSSPSKKVTRLSIIMLLYIILITPAIVISKIDWLILLNGPISLFVCIGFIIFTIKQYKNYTP
ncbi:MAG: hypothetical protein ACRC68_15380 [Clostridium sp.]